MFVTSVIPPNTDPKDTMTISEWGAKNQEEGEGLLTELPPSMITRIDKFLRAYCTHGGLELEKDLPEDRHPVMVLDIVIPIVYVGISTVIYGMQDDHK